jgi:hypothetical protein
MRLRSTTCNEAIEAMSLVQDAMKKVASNFRGFASSMTPTYLAVSFQM